MKEYLAGYTDAFRARVSGLSSLLDNWLGLKQSDRRANDPSVSVRLYRRCCNRQRSDLLWSFSSAMARWRDSCMFAFTACCLAVWLIAVKVIEIRVEEG